MKYCVVKVVPDTVRYEPINIGVVIHDPVTGAIRSRFSKELERLRTYADEGVNIPTLESLLTGFEHYSRELNLDRDFLDGLARTQSHVIQFTEPAGTLATSIDTELGQLYDRLISLDGRGRRGTRAVSRNSVVARVRRVFEGFRVPVETRQILRGVRSQYKFDFTLRQDAALRTFQCFSFVPADPFATVEEAKILAYSVKDIREHAHRTSEEPISHMRVTAFVNPPQEETEASHSARAILGDVAEVQDAEELSIGRYVERLVVPQ